MVWNALLLLALTAEPGFVGGQAPSCKDKAVRGFVYLPPEGGSDAAGRALVAPRKTPAAIVQMLGRAFDKLANDKQFRSALRDVGGEDAEMLSAATIQPLVKQLLVISPGERDFTKMITGINLQA